jgi:predicted N-acyltransferase
VGLAGRAGALAKREGQQYHWRNAGYATFDDFLAALSSGRRKTIRRERRDAQAAVEIVCLTGARSPRITGTPSSASTWTPAIAQVGPALSESAFFSHLSERMADKVLLVMARAKGAGSPAR